MKYLSKFNICRLQQMFTSINLIKTFFKKNICSIYAEICIKTKIYKSFIRSSCYVNELIYNNFTKFFNFNVREIKYYIIFFND